MQLHAESRAIERADLKLPVHYRHKGANKFIGGVMQNYSEAGITFETSHAIEPGTEIFIIIENVISNTNILNTREANYAEVEWCQATANCDAYFYKVGAKFFDF